MLLAAILHRARQLRKCGIPASGPEAEKQPSLQFSTPQQLGELAVFLCSDAAANGRGRALAVDGGWTAQ